MVILKWLHSMLVGNRSELAQAGAGQASEENKKAGKNRSIDLVNATLVDHAEDLDDLISFGSSWIERKKIKKKVRQKVERIISKEFNDPEIIEEVTERITDAAEIDPYYKNLFCKDAE